MGIKYDTKDLMRLSAGIDYTVYHKIKRLTQEIRVFAVSQPYGLVKVLFFCVTRFCCIILMHNLHDSGTFLDTALFHIPFAVSILLRQSHNYLQFAYLKFQIGNNA